jgi:hypothetical protein
MAGPGLTAFDVVFAVVMLSLFLGLLIGIVVVMQRLSRQEARLRNGHCPRCGGADIEHRTYVRDGERAEDSRHAAWFCRQCSRVVHIGPKQA